MNLREKLALLVEQSRDAYEKGNIEEGNRLKGEAETVSRSLKALDELNNITIPTDPASSVSGSNVATVSVVTGANQETDANKGIDTSLVAATQDDIDPVAQAAYITRFGTTEKAVDQILVDLHGQDHQNKYWEQKKAFGIYLRSDPQLPLPTWVNKALTEVILTPEVVKGALFTGFSDVESMKATMVSGINTLGGYVVPVDVQSRIVSRIAGMTIMRGRAFTTNTSRDRVEFPVVTGGDSQYTSAVRVTWVDETPAPGVADTNLTWGLEHIPVHTVLATTNVSRNNLEDAAYPVESILIQKFAEASAIDEDNQFLTGDGVGKPQGVLPGGTNLRGLSEVNSGSGTDVTWDGLTKLTWGLDSQYRQNAVFIGARLTYQNIALLKDGENRPYWNQNAFNMSDDGKQTMLKGHMVLEQETMPAIATDAFPLLFMDPSAYQIVDRVGMTIERYLDSSTAEINQVKFVMRRRLGGQLTDTWKCAVQKIAT